MSKENTGVDYQKKYMDLRARFIESLDIAFRSGYEQGYNESQVQAQAEQAQMMAQQMQAQQAQMQGGQIPPGMEGQAAMPGQQQQGSEMDSAIAELESLINKSEITKDDLKKSIEALKTQTMLNKISKMTLGLKKAETKKLLPPAYSKSFSINLSENSKQAVTGQQKIVDDLLSKWSDEQSKSTRDISQVLNTEILTKKE